MEGGFRVPCILRWPGHVPADSVQNGIFSGMDWFPTFLAAAGNPDITNQLLKGVKLGDRTYKNHLDGYDQTAAITGKGPSTRHEIFYLGESTVGAVRIDDYKYRFIDQPQGWLGEKTHVDVPYLIQPAPRSVRAPGLAERRDERRRAAILRLVQVPILALCLCPAGDGQGTPDLPRISADAAGRELQSRCRESGDGEKDGNRRKRPAKAPCQ